MDTATFASTLMPFDTANAVSEPPAEIQLLPAGGQVQTVDGRGPYGVADLQSIIDASFADTDRLEIDVNHATFLAGPKGGDAPAVGWIVSMNVRDGALWGHVEWTDRGAQLVGDKAYRGISPVLRHEPGTKRVARVINASLTNRPNIKGLQTLHMEEPSMDWLIEMLGLEAGATEEDMQAAIRALMDGAAGDKDEMSMNAQMVEIGQALGLPKDAQATAIVAAAKKAKTSGAELITLHAQVEALQKDRARDKSEAWLDGQIRDGRGVPGKEAVRDALITMHMENPEQAQAMVDGFPDLSPSKTKGKPPVDANGQITLKSVPIVGKRSHQTASSAWPAAMFLR
ncbi:MAG: phage protease, partial [Pseudomonadota bacterium]